MTLPARLRQVEALPGRGYEHRPGDGGGQRLVGGLTDVRARGWRRATPGASGQYADTDHQRQNGGEEAGAHQLIST